MTLKNEQTKKNKKDQILSLPFSETQDRAILNFREGR